MSKRVTKKEITEAVYELIKYSSEINIETEDFNKKGNKTFKKFLFDKKLSEVIDKLSQGEYKEYSIETIVFEEKQKNQVLKNQLILEWEQYKNMPKTNLTYRYDSGNTNTKTKDHIHVFLSNNQLYAINQDGTTHDGSKARLGKKELNFLKTMGFIPPTNGILEWITLDFQKNFFAINVELLFG